MTETSYAKKFIKYYNNIIKNDRWAKSVYDFGGVINIINNKSMNLKRMGEIAKKEWVLLKPKYSVRNPVVCYDNLQFVHGLCYPKQQKIVLSNKIKDGRTKTVVFLHELAHLLNHRRNFTFKHGPNFMYFFIYLLNKYTNIKKKDAENIARMLNVKFVSRDLKNGKE